MTTLVTPTESTPSAAPVPSDAELSALRTPRYRRVRQRHAGTSLVLRASVPVAILLLWAVATATGAVSPQILPSPAETGTALGELVVSGQLWTFLGASFARIGGGVSIGVGIGLVLGLVSGLFALGEELVDVTLQIVRAVPFLAIVPLFIAWFGIGEPFKIAVIAFATVAPMYAYVYLAVRSIDPRIIEAAKGYGLTGTALVGRAVVPLSLPGILMALRISLSISITALIGAETVGTRTGIGYLVTLAQEYNRVDYMFVAIILYALLGVLFDVVIRLVERLALPWRPTVAAR